MNLSSRLFLADLQYVDGLGEVSGAQEQRRSLRRMCQVLSQCQPVWPRLPGISIRLRCEQPPPACSVRAEQARAGYRSLLRAENPVIAGITTRKDSKSAVWQRIMFGVGLFGPGRRHAGDFP